MIEINLVEQKKAKAQAVVFGMDLKKVNLKLIALSIIMLYVPDFTIYQYWQEERASVQNEINNLTQKVSVLNQDLEGHDNIRKELAAYNEQIDKLKKRSEQIDQILKYKINPKKLLERIARNMPQDLWFERLEITGEKEIRIVGQSTSYKSIGAFIVSIKETPFFGESFSLKESKTKEETFLGKLERVEEFSLGGRIEVFDPFEK